MCTAKYALKENRADGPVPVCRVRAARRVPRRRGRDLIRNAVELVLQELIEVEATEVVGAGRYERSEHR